MYVKEWMGSHVVHSNDSYFIFQYLNVA